MSDETTEQIRESLGNVTLFSEISEGQMKRLSEAAKLTSHEEGVALIEEGGTTDALFVIADGSVRVWTNALGNEVELKTLEAGDYFGEVSLMSGKAATANVAAGEKGCTVVTIPRDSFLDVHDANADVRKKLEGVTLARAKDTIGKVLQ